uniref:Uncharacterized protein n=1 Tax=Candidatus Kentrum sp. LFY TaxID=2126342 RepID=A0A450WI58_9GAMM|nr:MAG: hypothetical protein BECKLFY1418C_GA0070996_102535 [Candidatus Kentron sp. LFY]
MMDRDNEKIEETGNHREMALWVLGTLTVLVTLILGFIALSPLFGVEPVPESDVVGTLETIWIAMVGAFIGLVTPKK